MDVNIKSFDSAFKLTVKDGILKIILHIVKSSKEVKELALIALDSFKF